jgi:hypothetical protein
MSTEPQEEPTAEWGLTIPLDRKYQPAVLAAAAQELTKMAGYGRKLLLTDLQTRGFLDENFEPVINPEKSGK